MTDREAVARYLAAHLPAGVAAPPGLINMAQGAIDAGINVEEVPRILRGPVADDGAQVTHQLLPGFGTHDDLVGILAVSPFLHWLPGLRGTGYEIAHADDHPRLSQLQKRCLAALPPNPVAKDCVLLRYPDGASIPAHTDVERPAEGPPLRHHRLFLLTQASTSGGVLSINGVAVPLAQGDAVIFEPCAIPHEVSPVTGSRLMFTVGVWTLT